jgi:hypothetical protein
MIARQHRISRVNLVIAAFVVQSFLPVTTASAAHSATVQRSVAASTSEWRAVAVPEGGPPVDQPLTLVWARNQGSAYQIFDIVNSGTIDLGGVNFHATVLLTSGGNARPLEVTFDACVGGSWTVYDSCTGAVLNIGTTTTSLTTNVNHSLAVGDRLSVQASTTPSGSSQWSTTLDISVDTTHIRPTAASSP